MNWKQTKMYSGGMYQNVGYRMKGFVNMKGG